MNFVPTRPDPPEADVSDDAVLGGRLRLLQPRGGHRFGHDAILLAAATDARVGDHAVDLGAGVGAAGLALAVRCPDVRVTLVELDGGLASLAAENARRNGLADRVSAVTLDVGAPAAKFVSAGLRPSTIHRVLMNPPFNDARRSRGSPDAARKTAHVASGALLAAWTKTALRLLRPNGVLTLIWRADALADVLDVLARGFGSIDVMPVHPKPDAPAIRVLVRAVKGSRAPLALHSALVLNDADGKPGAAIEQVLRGSRALSFER